MALSSRHLPGATVCWTDRRVTLMGLGRHGGGLGAARYLAERGARLTISEQASRDQLSGSLAALSALPIHAQRFGGHDPQDFADAEFVVVNPAVRPEHPCLDIARAAGAVVTSEIELLLRACPARVIGVTGSNGKSTTASMLAAILAAAGWRTWLGGNIGGSLLDHVDQMRADDWVVLELSSFQLAHLSDDAPPLELAVITNCTPNHLDWHGDFRRYAAAKRRIVRSTTTTAVVDPHEPFVASWPAAQSLCPAWPTEDLPPLAVPGQHNRRNATLAAAAAIAAGASASAVRASLATFRGLPHRLQLVADVSGRRFYNDSKSTTPAATAAAFSAVEGPLWLLAGGVSKGASFDELAALVVRRARGAAVFGNSADQWSASLRAAGADFETARCASMAEAFAWCASRSRAGESILLSPACSSYDQFRDFEERGAAFCKLVETLTGDNAGIEHPSSGLARLAS